MQLWFVDKIDLVKLAGKVVVVVIVVVPDHLVVDVNSDRKIGWLKSEIKND